MLPTFKRTPTIPLHDSHLQFVQDTRSEKSSDSDDQATPGGPSIDDLFNDLPNDPPGALPTQPEPLQLNAEDAPPPDEEPSLTEEEEAQKCRDLAILRDQEINGTDKQQGAIEYCEQSRREINNIDHRVVNLSIDISPPKPKGGFKCDRDWKDIAGKILISGRPDNYDAISRTVTIKSPDGKLHQLQFDELGLADRKQFLAMYRLPMDCTIVGQGSPVKPRHWTASTFTWTASALCSKPNYFEEVQLERYGHSPGPIIGPIISSAHFFATFPVLPYKMGLTPPNECVYTLGYYRPGNCAPYLLDPIPLSVRAGLWQAGAWVGGVFLIP